MTKRDLAITAAGIALSIVIAAIIFFGELKFSYWGQYNSLPLEQRPEAQLVVSSYKRLVLLEHFVLLPLTSVCVGIFSGTFARRPAVVAFVALLPLRLLQFIHDGFSLKSQLSMVLDLVLAIAVAVILARVRRRPLEAI